jgi:hypothetical protein
MTELDSKIEQVLKDLYQIDPLFKEHEAKVRILIKEVLLSKPETKFDQEFARDLRRKLMAQADLMKEKRDVSLLRKASLLKKVSYSLGFVALAAIVAAGGLYYKDSKKPGRLADITSLLSGSVNISKQKSNAFGKLALSSPLGTPTGSGGNEAAPQNDAAAKSSPSFAYGMGGGGNGIDAKIMPPMVNYQYVYKGGEFTVDSAQMDVYRRIKTAASAGNMAAYLRGLDFGLLDMGSFSNLSLQNMNIMEDKDFGYSFYINMQESSISASENWQRWQTPDRQCRDQQCYESLRLKMADLPSDQSTIDLANRFLKDHKISTANFDEPFVDSTWKLEYESATDKTNSYIPNILTVIYPLKVDGHVIYDEGGRKTGLYASVDVRVNKVSGFGELYAQNYDSSTYAVETDSNKLIKLAEKGGLNSAYYAYENAAKTETIELGTPEFIYIKHYQYSPDGGTSTELLVPALSFPITKTPAGQFFYQKNVIVPLPRSYSTAGQSHPYHAGAGPIIILH